MKIKFDSDHLIPVVMGAVIIIADIIYLINTVWFYAVLLIAFLLMIAQYMIDYFSTLQKITVLEDKFPSFVRDLVATIKTGIPLPKAIMGLSVNDYGELTPYIKKLGNQMEWDISAKSALKTFAQDTESKVIMRAIETVIEAEKYGGNIEEVLTSITSSLTSINKIRNDRQASIQGTIIQNYIIFFVFLIIMVVIRVMIIPYLSQAESTSVSPEVAGLVQTGLSSLALNVKIILWPIGTFFASFAQWLTSLNGLFLMMAVIQGLFTGLVGGKLAEGSFRAGLKHSFIMVVMAFIIVSLIQSL
ncbi:type II secretion system F family protein [Nanoarchaeota archaeon]